MIEKDVLSIFKLINSFSITSSLIIMVANCPGRTSASASVCRRLVGHHPDNMFFTNIFRNIQFPNELF